MKRRVGGDEAAPGRCQKHKNHKLKMKTAAESRENGLEDSHRLGSRMDFGELIFRFKGTLNLDFVFATEFLMLE